MKQAKRKVKRTIEFDDRGNIVITYPEAPEYVIIEEIEERDDLGTRNNPYYVRIENENASELDGFLRFLLLLGLLGFAVLCIFLMAVFHQSSVGTLPECFISLGL
jgi:hypothetical protein